MTVKYFTIFNATVIFDDVFEWDFGQCTFTSIQRAAMAVMVNHNFNQALILDRNTGECMLFIENVTEEDLEKMEINPDEYDPFS